MRRLFAISSTGNRFVHRSLLGKGKCGTAPPSFSHCSFWVRDFSGVSYDCRKISRNRLNDLKLDDAIGLFGDMVKSRPFPSIIEFSKLLSAIAKMKKFDLVISFGEKMEILGISHNLYTYSIFINCFCRRSQLSLALAVLAKMMKLGYEPSIVTLNSLLNGFCHGNRISDAVALVDQMVEMGYKPDTVTFTTLIHGLFQAGDCDSAQMVFKQMVSNRVHPNILTYNILLDGLCKNGKLDTALVIFKYLQKSEMELDIFIYNTMIEGMCKAGKVGEAWDLFCSLSTKPDVVTYTTMISGLCSKRLLQEADDLFRKMKEDGTLPNSGTYNTLIRANLRDCDRAASAELIKEMRSSGFVGDASTISLVTNMLHDGRLDKSFLNMLS